MGAIRKLEEQIQLNIDDLSVKQQYIYDIHKNDDDKCWITIAQKQGRGRKTSFSQWHYKFDDLVANADSIVPNNDSYLSMNSFYRTYRRTEYLRQLNCLYLDIDCYSVGLTKQQAWWHIDSMLMGDDIPYPNKIVDSGNGLYLIWELKRTPGQALPLWNAVQRWLFKKFEHLGADRQALDCTRVLRIAGTNNTKNGVIPVYERYKQDFYGPYELRDIQKKYLPELTPAIEPKAATKKGRKPTVVRMFKEETLCYYRTLDIVKICELREWDLEGHREHILFLYRLYSIQVYEDNERALEDVLELNSQFIQPLSKREATKATRSAEKKEYKYKNETIIELLDITAEEQKHLLTIIGKTEIQRRNTEAKRKSRRNEKGLTQRDQSKIDKYNQVKELYEQGLKQVKIKEITGLSKQYVSKIIKELKAK